MPTLRDAVRLMDEWYPPQHVYSRNESRGSYPNWIYQTYQDEFEYIDENSYIQQFSNPQQGTQPREAERWGVYQTGLDESEAQRGTHYENCYTQIRVSAHSLARLVLPGTSGWGPPDRSGGMGASCSRNPACDAIC